MTAIAVELLLPEPGRLRSAVFSSSPSSANSRKSRSARERSFAPCDSCRPSGGSGLRISAERGVVEGIGGLGRDEPDRRPGEECGEDDYLTPHETRSVASCCTTTGQSEFYDAFEDFSLDGSGSLPSPSSTTKAEFEVHAFQIKLLEAIARRKRAEKILPKMQGQWQRLINSLSRIGILTSISQSAGEAQLQIDPIAVSQEILYTRAISEAVERHLSWAESEATLRADVDRKNHDISRLQKRLNYCKLVNFEMRQRNREIAELAHQQHVRRQQIRRRIWSSIGLSVTVGASLGSLYVYSYLPCFVNDTRFDDSGIIRLVCFRFLTD